MKIKTTIHAAIGMFVNAMLLFAFCSCNNLTNPAASSPLSGTIKGKAVYENTTDNSGISIFLESVDSSGEALSVIRSAATGKIARSAVFETTTGSDGTYEITDVAAGTYTVYASSNNSLEKEAYTKVTVTAGASVTAVDLELTATGSISGKVTVTNGSAGGALVGIAGTSYMAFCDSDGKFTISGVPVGTQKLSVYIDGTYKAFDDEYTVSEGTTASAGTIAITRSASASSNATNYVTCTATDNGIRFGVYVSNNQSVSTTTTTTSSTSSTTTTTTSSRVSSNYDLSITDTDNNIVMDKTFGITNTYGITVYYPLVTKGTLYNFTVQCKYDGYIYFTESFSVTATGGLGELKVSNADELEPKLDTSTKTASRTAAVLDTNSFTGTIQRKGTYYQVGRGADWSAAENYWIINGVRWSDNTDQTFPLKNVYAISGWRSYDWVNYMLSGHTCFVESQTYLEIAGYTDDDNVVFKMNDYKLTSFDWGGSKVKTLTVYGVSSNSNSVFFDYTTDTAKDTITDILNKVHLSNMPGSDVALTSEGTTTTYKFAEITDFGSDFLQPAAVPSATGGRFTGWNVSFPCIHSNYTSVVTADNGITYCIEYCYAHFDITSHTVQFMMNEGDTSTVYTTVTVNDNGNATAGSISTIWYYAKLPEDPTRSGYTFKGWYTDSSCLTELTTFELLDGTKYFYTLDYSELYAKWD